MRHPTLYLPRDRGLHRLNPLTTLSLALFVFVLASTLPETWQLLALFLVGALPLAAWSRVLTDYIMICGRLILPFAISLFLIQGFFAPGETELVRLLGFALTVEGIQLGARFTARILAWLGAAVLLMISTRPDRLVAALVGVGLPHQLGYIVLTSLQIIPQMQGRAQTILDAQRSRGLETGGGPLSRARALVPLVGPLLLSSIIELDRRAIALEARGFKRAGRRTFYVELSDSAAQRGFRLALLVAAAVWIPLRVLSA